jgi:hypothetical protein
MTARDKLLALRAEKAPKTGGEDAAAQSPEPARYPERHCPGCGKAGTEDNPLIEDGRHRTCAFPVVCWHCGRAVYRPRRLAWGKDIIPLHDHCCGPWIDAWDALLNKGEPDGK